VSDSRLETGINAELRERVLGANGHVHADQLREPNRLNDIGNARRLVQQHGSDLRYCPKLGWMAWSGKRWGLDDTGAVDRCAKKTVRSIYGEAENCPDKDRREALASWAHKSESDVRIKAMISLARTEAEVIVRHERLDRDPWLLNVGNGTLNLKTGELRQHRWQDLITKITPIDLHRGVDCPRWKSFLERVTDGNNDLIRYLQKAVGYSCTGSTREQRFFMPYGTGANGKTTFLNTISAVLGDYAKHTATETLLVRRGDSISNDVARLAGARFVSAVETESGRRLAEGLVKQMTGGDKMAARFLHQEFFEFVPAFKLWLAVNHKPRVTGTDHAIWRRIDLIPFVVTIPESERDPDLAEKLQEELPGILAWAVAGCKLWQAEGLESPETVKTATAEYKQESDIVATFIEERCEQGPDCEVSKTALYEAYSEWSKKSGEFSVSKKEFGMRLAEKGFKDGRTGKQRFWAEISLRNDT
jgi:putative DNA primase/helicase